MSPVRGFALVVTLSLMVLLVIVAVGLLTLSAVSLRASVSSQDHATARANARLALMMALGELQKTAGPDQRVTARADVLGESIANPRLTGVWQSWEIKATSPPQSGDYNKAERDKKFVGWLASSADGVANRQLGFANANPAPPVVLWGNGTLGPNASGGDRVRAAVVPVNDKRGALAWAVLDEGVKARINTGFDASASSDAAKTAQLGAGRRPGVELVNGLSGLERRFFENRHPVYEMIEKGISAENYAMVSEEIKPGIRDALRALTHDVTTHSQGLFTDTARGGLRKDFHLLSNQTDLPTEYRGKGVYESLLGITGPSDPRWESLYQFARVHRDGTLSNAGGVPVLSATTPTGWAAANASGVLNPSPPPGAVLMPSIAKVQVLFGLIARDFHDYPIGGSPVGAPVMHGVSNGSGLPHHFTGTSYHYNLRLTYTPIVTLHNPYNVAIDLKDVKVEFIHAPFAMQVFRNGLPQSTGLVPLETMYMDNLSGQKGKAFAMSLKTMNASGAPGGTTFQMLPGEVKMFSLHIDPNYTYRQELTLWGPSGTAKRKFWDTFMRDNKAATIDAIPGWREGVGFETDGINGNLPVDRLALNGRWGSLIALAWNDQIHVEFAPLSIPLSNNKFVVRMTAGTGTQQKTVNAIEMDYDNPEGLRESLLGSGGTLRFPPSGTVSVGTLHQHARKPVWETKPTLFALLSVQAKTTSGARDASEEDGRFATKPWCFAHAAGGVSMQKIPADHPANHSHEIALQVLPGGNADNLLQVDPLGRTNFISGHASYTGVKFGAMYEIPLGPVQTFAALNGANPGGASAFLPRFARPIGNSWAHPLLPADKLRHAVGAVDYLDHSFLGNLAFYDGFYFSGLADQSGPFGGGRSAGDLAKSFASGGPLEDPRLVFHRPDGREDSAFEADVAKRDGFREIAAWQMMKGAFNINSTSEDAWVAMLASIHDPQALVNQLDKAGGTSAMTGLGAAPLRNARISRFRLPASLSAAAGAEAEDAYWLGPREYPEADLRILARNIVKQVRARGPFLSLADFVNRQLGSGPAAQRGALQQAIDDSNLNAAPAADANAGYDITISQVSGYNHANPEAGAGPSYQGAPGFLCQEDLLGVLGNAATARSDTFTIRGYGEARDPSGTKVLSRATCEAVVQRFPEWIDPKDPAATSPPSSQANQSFGRRFSIISFRWLAADEI